MRKKFQAAIIALVTILLAGCSNLNISSHDYYVYNTSDFSEDVAWLLDRYSGDECYVCINKQGEALFEYDCDLVDEVTPFTDGYSFLIGDEFVAVIDKTGDIQSKRLLNETTKLAGYGGGYYVIEEYVGGFSESSYKYTMYSPAGDIVTDDLTIELTNGDSIGTGGSIPWKEITYCGKHVFYFRGAYGNIIYFVDSGVYEYKDIKSYEFNDQTLTFYSDLAYFGDGFTEKNGEDYYITTFIDYLGNRSEISFPRTVSWINVATCPNENKYIVYSFKENLIVYDFSDNKLYYMPDEYSEKVIWDELPELLIFQDDRIALPLEGEDGNKYICVFDSRWNLIGDPTVYDEYGNFSSGLLWITDGNTTTYYDINFEKQFSMSNNDFRSNGYTVNMISYSTPIKDFTNGTLIISKPLDSGLNYAYIDASGQPLFKGVNSSNIENKTQQLSEF